MRHIADYYKRHCIAIPARLESSRLKHKLLIELDGVPVIKRCYDNVKKCGLKTFVLTDSQQIADIIGKDAHIVDGDFRNGTERIAAAEHMGMFDSYTDVINVQGDQPLVDPNWITTTINLLKTSQIAHLYTNLKDEDKTDPSVVKLIRSGDNLLWMTRNATYGERGVSIYGYSRFFLQMHRSLEVPEEEIQENVEQLRWLKAGVKVRVDWVNVPDNFVDINTQKDVDKWRIDNDAR